MIKITLTGILLCLFMSPGLHSQGLFRSVITLTGNTHSNSDGYISYSAGEAITGSFILPVNGISQGFQQPTSKPLPPPLINAVEVYPNPVQSDLNILFNIGSPKILKIDLISGRGTIASSYTFNVLQSDWIILDMTEIPAGIYLLHVYSSDKQIERTFKIEKM